MKWTYFKSVIRLLIYLPIGFLVLFALLIGTTFGSKITINALDLLVPSLSLEYGSGIINKELTLNAVGWLSNNVSVVTSNLTVKWNPNCILRKQLCLSSLSAIDTHIDVTNTSVAAKTGKTVDPKNVYDFPLPFTIKIDDGSFHNIHVNIYDQNYAAKDLIFTGSWLKEGLTLKDLNSLDLMISGITEKSADPGKVDKSLSHNILPLVNLPFPISIEQSHLKQSRIELFNRDYNIKDIKINGDWSGTKLNLEELTVNYANTKILTEGVIDFKDNYPLNLSSKLELDLNRSQKSFPEIPWGNYLKDIKQQTAFVRLTNDLSRLKISSLLSGDINTQVTATVHVLTPNFPTTARFEDLNTKLEFNDEFYIAKNSNLTLNGDISKVRFQVSGNFESPYFPSMNLLADTYISSTKVDVASADVKLTDGAVKFSGVLGWENGYEWNAKADFNNFYAHKVSSKIKKTIPDLLLNGHIHTTGRWGSDQWAFNIKNSNISGNLNQLPLAIKGSVEANSEYKLVGEAFEAKLLGSHIRLGKAIVNGIASTKASILIPEISTWNSLIHGGINARFTTIQSSEPVITNGFEYDIQLNNLKFKTYTSETTLVKGHFFPIDNQLFKAKLISKNLTINNYLIKRLKVIGEGDKNDQDFDVNIRSKYNLQSKIHSQQADNHWKVTIPLFDVHTKHARWGIDKAIQVNWNQQSLLGIIQPFCLKDDSLSLCLKEDGRFGKQGSFVTLLEGKLDKLIKPLLPAHLAVEGNATIIANIDWEPKKKPTARLSLTLDPGKAILYPRKKMSTEFNYQSLTLNVKLSKKSLKIESNLVANDLINWNAEIEILNNPTHKLNGNIHLNNIQLTPFSGFLPMYENLSGRISSQLDLKGSLENPIIKGSVNLHDAELALVRNPTKIHDLNLKMVLENQSGRLTGNWKMGEGDANLNGDIKWPQGKLSGNLNVSGKNITLIQPPLAILIVSPNVSVKIAQHNIDINGEIIVESGEITIASLPKQGIPISDDVIFSDQQMNVGRKNYIQITSNLNIDVNDKLKIEGLGLAGILSGKLLYRQEPESLPTLFGNIKINDGIYRFLGQTLNVSQSNLNFSGPSNNPTLNIEATKRIKEEDLNVGVRIVGTAQKPIVSLFSNPNKEQAEIVSYLIQGRGFSNYDDQANNSLLLSAALTLGTHIGDNAIGSIGDTAENLVGKLGISNVQLNANDDGKIAISGFVGKKLRLKYGYGVFTPGYELSVRYYLLSQLYLESISSALGQSLDIYYRFDIE